MKVGDLGALRQRGGIIPPELERDGVLDGIEVEVAVAIAAQDGVGGHHLGVEQGPPGELPHKVAVVAIRPVHHGGDAQGISLGSVAAGFVGLYPCLACQHHKWCITNYTLTLSTKSIIYSERQLNLVQFL